MWSNQQWRVWWHVTCEILKKVRLLLTFSTFAPEFIGYPTSFVDNSWQKLLWEVWIPWTHDSPICQSTKYDNWTNFISSWQEMKMMEWHHQSQQYVAAETLGMGFCRQHKWPPLQHLRGVQQLLFSEGNYWIQKPNITSVLPCGLTSLSLRVFLCGWQQWSKSKA